MSLWYKVAAGLLASMFSLYVLFGLAMPADDYLTASLFGPAEDLQSSISDESLDEGVMINHNTENLSVQPPTPPPSALAPLPPPVFCLNGNTVASNCTVVLVPPTPLPQTQPTTPPPVPVPPPVPSSLSPLLSPPTSVSNETMINHSYGEKWYVSSHPSAKYYYCEESDGWKNLSKDYLQVYDSEEELLEDFPNHTLHGSCAGGEDESKAEIEAEVSIEQSSEPAAEQEQGVQIECIDINSATKEELMDIKWLGGQGIIAQKVIDSRETEGPFASIDDLTRVSGIGDSKLDDIKQQGLACVQ
ncbi:MAG: helix-hairpin-helix domain-containing protein [Candidatus Colwellbacteria bacterium]|nr:helix-hairpin-helix domain-containing protein [Candidatus Colwellbacteria bacterium]